MKIDPHYQRKNRSGSVKFSDVQIVSDRFQDHAIIRRQVFQNRSKMDTCFLQTTNTK